MGEPMILKRKQILIAVCLKQVSFLYTRSGSSPDQAYVDARDWVRFNNPADEEALELALNFKEKGGDVRVWVFCLASRILPREASRVLAMGADRFIWLNDPQWVGDDSHHVAAILSEAVKRSGANLIICGAASLDADRGEVGPLIAHHLAFPLIPYVTSLEYNSDGNKIRVESSLGRGDRLISNVTLPLVATVDQGTTQVRYPSHVAMLKAEEQGVSSWGRKELAAGINYSEPDSFTSKTGAPRPRVKPIPLLDGQMPAHDRINWLLAARNQDRGGEVIKGDAPSLAKTLVNFLEKQGLWGQKKPS